MHHQNLQSNIELKSFANRKLRCLDDYPTDMIKRPHSSVPVAERAAILDPAMSSILLATYHTMKVSIVLLACSAVLAAARPSGDDVQRMFDCAHSNYALTSLEHFEFCLQARPCVEGEGTSCDTCYAFNSEQSTDGVCWECDPTSDKCEEGRCDAGICIEECKIDAECGQGFSCIEGHCSSKCFADSDCPQGTSCFADGRYVFEEHGSCASHAHAQPFIATSEHPENRFLATKVDNCIFRCGKDCTGKDGKPDVTVCEEKATCDLNGGVGNQQYRCSFSEED